MNNFYTQLAGGLGNQLFQYVFSKSYSLKNNMSFKVDKDTVLPKHTRKYGLKYFNINVDFADGRRFLKYRERSPNYYESVFNDDFTEKYICGYWQSYKYFSEYWDEIKKELSFKDSFMNEFKIDPDRSVSVHFRRTDFVTLKRYNFICENSSYYNRAVNYITSYVKDPIFYIFSDDINWAKTFFVNNYEKVYVSEILNDHIHELEIMSNCKYAITANSTFSWWGAYLGVDKKVATPEIWYSDNYISVDSLIPPNWEKIKI